MTNTTAVELDFFQMEKASNSSSPPLPAPQKLFHRRRSFRDIHGVISKLNPELLKSVIGSGSVPDAAKSPESEAPFSKPPRSQFPPPLPAFRSEDNPSESSSGTGPMTIFYNGTVAVFDVSREKVEDILKMAEAGLAKAAAADPSQERHLMETLDGDLPIARRKSLQCFLAKRKDRVTVSWPYLSPEKGTSSRR